MGDASIRSTEQPGIEELPAMTVASCHVVGDAPEMRSRKALVAWAETRGLPVAIGEARHFGFNNPDTCDPPDPAHEHGYECWMTVPEGTAGGEGIVVKHFAGGRYATTETTVAVVGAAWRELLGWLEASDHAYGESQWLEELLALEAATEAETRLKLLLPIRRI